MNLQNTQAELNESLAIKHMRRVVRCAVTYRDAPIQVIRDESLRTARAESRVLRTLATNSGDPTLNWAANESELVVSQMERGG